MKKLFLLSMLLLSACSYSNVTVPVSPAGCAPTSITIHQERKGWDSVLPMKDVKLDVPLTP